MTILNPEQLTKLRQGVARDIVPVTWNKAQINAASQAVEDWFDNPARRASLRADINAATSPFTFSNAQFKKLVKHWLHDRFGRE